MKIPHYWAQGSAHELGSDGKRIEATCWGWSDSSEADARRTAEERATRVVRARASGTRGSAEHRYDYQERMPHEEVIERDPAGCAPGSAVITRNAYGARILNCAGAAFVDIDLPYPTRSVWDFLRRKPRPDPAREATARVEAWATGRDRRLRCYRTAGGLRLLLLHRTFDPTADETQRLMESLGADPIYRRLCLCQESFRARLSPKPWRLGLRNPPLRRPNPANVPGTRAQAAWVADYEAASRERSVCRLLGEFGRADTDPALTPIVQLHDAATGARLESPLA